MRVMRRAPTPFLVPILVLMATALCLAPMGCGGRSVGVGPLGAQDGGAPQEDGGIPGVFCSGGAKMSFAGQERGVPVTASPIIMDCCEGSTLHFHGQPWFGFDAAVMFRTAGMWMTGEFQLDDLPQNVEVGVSRAGDWEWIELTMEGTLRVTQPGGSYAGKTFHPDFRIFAQVWRRSGRGSSGVDSRSEGLCGAVLGSRLRWVDAAVPSSELF